MDLVRVFGDGKLRKQKQNGATALIRALKGELEARNIPTRGLKKKEDLKKCSAKSPETNQNKSINILFYFMSVHSKVILDKVLGEGEQVMLKMDKIVARIVRKNLPLGCT